MINICIYCNPNYSNVKKIQSVNKCIDLVTQFIILYKSIKQNWTNFEYKINLFYNKNIKWSNYDKYRINKLKDLNIISVDKGDHPLTPWQTRIPCFNYPLKDKGTHRLVLDCDMIALNNPEFDLTCDWQAMYAGNVTIDKYYINFILNKYNYVKKINNNLITKDLFINYILNTNINKLFPYFNAGAILLKEDLCNKFINLWKPSLSMINYKNLPKNIKHISLQYSLSFSLINISENWKLFKPGFNYLLKVYDINKFGKNNISLIHYCGKNAGKLILNEFPEYFSKKFLL